MTALPNHTCYQIEATYGIETPFNVLEVDVIRFDRSIEGFQKRYGTHAVMVNGKYNHFLLQLADMSGSWSKVATAKSDAYATVERLDCAAERINVLWSKMTDKSQAQSWHKLCREYNDLNDLFLAYGVSFRRKVEHTIKGNTWVFVRENKLTIV